MGDAQGRGIHVVGGLRAVHMVVGVAIFVFTLLMAQQLKGQWRRPRWRSCWSKFPHRPECSPRGTDRAACPQCPSQAAQMASPIRGQHELHVRNGRGLRPGRAALISSGKLAMLTPEIGIRRPDRSDSIICIEVMHFTQNAPRRDGRFSCLRILNVL